MKFFDILPRASESKFIENVKPLASNTILRQESEGGGIASFHIRMRRHLSSFQIEKEATLSPSKTKGGQVKRRRLIPIWKEAVTVTFLKIATLIGRVTIGSSSDTCHDADSRSF
nr:hypothetical protein Iba_chr02aCG14240 [Ipomoea batatas]